MPDIPTLSLKTAQFNPIVFNPTQYEYQGADMSILERSLAQKEARMKEAAQNKSAIDRSLGELEMKLNPSEAKWFENYKQDIKNQIQTSIDSGDFGEAIRTSTYLAGSIFQDPRILGRIRSQQAYQEELKTQQARRNNKEISQNTYDWWVANNKYSYNDITDGNGNYIEGSLWKASSTPVTDINWSEQAAKAFKLITPTKKVTNRGGGFNTTNVDGTGTGNKWQNDTQYEEVTVEDVLKNIQELLLDNPDVYRQVEQAFEVAKFDYNRLKKQYDEMSFDNPEKQILKQQLDARESMLSKNGGFIDYKEYYARMITNNHYANTLSYRNESTNVNNFNSNDYQPSNSGNSRGTVGGQGANDFYSQSSSWKGANVRYKEEYNLGAVNTYSSNIINLFDSNTPINNSFNNSFNNYRNNHNQEE